MTQKCFGWSIRENIPVTNVSINQEDNVGTLPGLASTKEERAGLGSAIALPNPCSQKTAAARKCHQEPRVMFPDKSGVCIGGGADLTTNITVQKTWRSCRGNKINREAGST